MLRFAAYRGRETVAEQQLRGKYIYVTGGVLKRLWCVDRSEWAESQFIINERRYLSLHALIK